MFWLLSTNVFLLSLTTWAAAHLFQRFWDGFEQYLISRWKDNTRIVILSIWRFSQTMHIRKFNKRNVKKTTLKLPSREYKSTDSTPNDKAPFQLENSPIQQASINTFGWNIVVGLQKVLEPHQWEAIFTPAVIQLEEYWIPTPTSATAPSPKKTEANKLSTLLTG